MNSKTFIKISVKKWQDSNGNTYHKVAIIDKKENVYISPLTYGYSSQWEKTALEILKEKKIKSLNNTFELYTSKDIALQDLNYVKRKKDLIF